MPLAGSSGVGDALDCQSSRSRAASGRANVAARPACASICTSPAPRRAATRARAAPARCWSTASASCPASRSRCSTKAARSRRSRGWRTTARCIRCSRRSSSMTASSAATARPARSARRSAWRRRSGAGVPSHVTADLSAETVALTRDELRERMSGNLCRCGAHNGIVDAIRETFGDRRRPKRRPRMTPFQYARAADVSAALVAGARAGAPLSRRRHQPRRPDARDDRAARRAGRRDRPVARDRGAPRRRPAASAPA